LITRPRRFGKTLNMSMLECFWSLKYQGRNDLFEGLNIWKEDKYRNLQGSYPVISLSFASVKEDNYDGTIYRIRNILKKLYVQHRYLLDSDVLTNGEKANYIKLMDDMPVLDATIALHNLSDYLCRYYGKKIIILLDEYDTPMQEAYLNGYWKKLISFTRNLFNSTFKTNPHLDRAIMTGITRVSKESIFSDLNNLNVVTTTSDEYAAYFGFTETEVFDAMDEFSLPNKEEVKKWYNGFTLGKHADIYNPWSIINFLDKGKLKPYWANTSSNSLVGNLIRTGSPDIKMQFEQLLSGETLTCQIDEEIVYNQLETNENAVWSLLLASGYLNTVEKHGEQYTLTLTNYEVKRMFENMVQDWFGMDAGNYNRFVKALLQGDLKAMNAYMNQVSLSMFSFFDTGNRPSEQASPERFYHGFVLGLLVELSDRYIVTSNRESGFGRYDVMLESLNKEDNSMILEFKVHDPEEETTLQETVQAALAQIEEKHYEQTLLDHGIKRENIHKYGFAFEGKKVLIG
nr:ATP-binding protein [Lachnospiraceae bacterium]